MKKNNDNKKDKDKHTSKSPNKPSDHNFARDQKTPKTDPSEDSSGNDPHEGPTKTP